MKKLKLKFQVLYQLLFSEETREIYIKAISVTWDILREFFSLIWLLFCSIFLVFFWGGNYSYQAVKNVQSWYSDMDEAQKKNIIGSAAGTLKQSLGKSPSLVEIAKSQLDIENDPPALKALPAAPKVEPKENEQPKEEKSESKVAPEDSTEDVPTENKTSSDAEPQITSEDLTKDVPTEEQTSSDLDVTNDEPTSNT